jgi:hypothetical protein
VEPLLRGWRGLDPEATNHFLSRACAEGYRFLARFEAHAPWQRDLYRTAQALFRNRAAGHAHVGRLFNQAIDFADIRPGRDPWIIVPALGGGDARAPGRGATPHALAERLLRSALGLSPDEGGEWVGFPEVRAAYEALARQGLPPPTPQGGRQIFPLHTLPGRGGMDLWFTGGLARAGGWDVAAVETKVRSALLYNPTAGDAPPAVPDDAELLRAVERIRAAARGKRPSEFDRWWADAREHRFLPLLGAATQDVFRDHAARRAHYLADALSWLSYKLMARCYGMLMLIACLDLRLHADFPTTEVEQWLFRHMHLPQLHLGGLPLDFFGKAQLRWVLPTLHDLWGQGAAEPEAYDVATDLLGHYGDLVRWRRDADRERKAAEVLPGTKVLLPADEESLRAAPAPDPADAETPPTLSSTACPRCGAGLRLVRVVLQQDENHVRAAFYCAGCKEERNYDVDLAELSRGRLAGG